MKRTLSAFGLAFLLVGCSTTSTSFQTVAGQFLTSTAITVDATMSAAAKLEVSGVITTNDWNQIASYYGQYRSAMIIATNTYNLAVQLNNSGLFTAASNNLQTAQASITTKVASVPQSIPGK